MSADNLNEKAEDLIEKIIDRYERFNVRIKITDWEIIGGWLKIKVKLPKGTSISEIRKHEEDLRFGLKVNQFRVITGSERIWMVVSLTKKTVAYPLVKILASQLYAQAIEEMAVAHPIGIDDLGHPIIQDLTAYPHLLIAGTTGSGKSTAVNALLLSLLCSYSPHKVNLLICDQVSDLLIFNGFPHLACPVVTDFEGFYSALQSLWHEMKRRMELKGTPEYTKLPYIVFVVDEFSSFISGSDPSKKEARKIMESILRQGRHARIHAVLVAFNPTAKNLELDLADLPSRMAFKVAKTSNSMAIIGCGGAEKLSGNGEMLLQTSQSASLRKIQGVYIAPHALDQMLNLLREKYKEFQHIYRHAFRINEKTAELPQELLDVPFAAKDNYKLKKFAKILVWALARDSISTNQIVQIFKIGWNSAKEIMLHLESLGIIGELESKLPRQVLIQSPTDLSDKTIRFLTQNGHTIEEISTILERKIQSRLNE